MIMNFNIIKRFLNFKRFFNFKSTAPQNKRSLAGSLPSRFVNWLYGTSYSKINLDLDTGLTTLLTRVRELAKNNIIVRSYLDMNEKNIIGKTGFVLQSQIKSADGKLNDDLNDYIEWRWWEFGKLSNGYLTVDGGMGHEEFDKLILRSLLTDGEVFIRVHKNSSLYGISFELIDAMSIDFTKMREFSGNQNAIVLGVEIDKNYKPVAYYFKPRNNNCISSGNGRKNTCIRDDSYIQKRISTASERNISAKCLYDRFEAVGRLSDCRIDGR